MAKKQRILPNWLPTAKIHDGWFFEGDYRVSSEVRDWVAGSHWPDTLPIKVEMEQAERGRLRVNIEVQLSADLPCQRCGQPIHWAETVAESVLLVREEEPNRPESQWVLDEEKLEIAELIAQEISLAMPDFPRHEHCPLQEPGEPN